MQTSIILTKQLINKFFTEMWRIKSLKIPKKDIIVLQMFMSFWLMLASSHNVVSVPFLECFLYIGLKISVMSDYNVKSWLSHTSFSVSWKIFLLEEKLGYKFVMGVSFLVISGPEAKNLEFQMAFFMTPDNEVTVFYWKLHP